MSTAVREPDSRGRVLTEATIENLEDLWAAKRGLLSPEEVRRSIVSDALVDTGATLLSLPRKLIAQLGLARTGTKRVTSSTGGGEAGMYEAVRLTICGRTCTMDVMEVPDDVPVLIPILTVSSTRPSRCNVVEIQTARDTSRRVSVSGRPSARRRSG